MSTRLRKVERLNTDVVDNREMLRVLTSFRNGNFSVRMPVDATGIAGKIYDALNDVIGSNERLAKELERVSNLIGKEGKINHRAAMPEAMGSWAACIESVNTLATDLIKPTVDVSRVIGAIAHGDLSQRMALEIDGSPFRGVFLQTVKTVNTMVDQLSTFTRKSPASPERWVRRDDWAVKRMFAASAAHGRI